LFREQKQVYFEIRYRCTLFVYKEIFSFKNHVCSCVPASTRNDRSVLQFSYLNCGNMRSLSFMSKNFDISSYESWGLYLSPVCSAMILPSVVETLYS
jgi:hypothetical protein